MVYYAGLLNKVIGDAKPDPKPKKEKKPIPKESKQRKIDNAKYRLLSKAFLIKYPKCQVKLKGCTIKAIEIHHDQGRGIRLNDVSNFVAICRNCHNIVENKNMKIKPNK